MKTTFMDRLISFFSPEAGLKRVSARLRSELVLRQYDAAQTFKFDDWTSATKTSANVETKAALSTIRDKARDAVRNNPHASRALSSIVSNTVGWGIEASIKGKNTTQTKLLNTAWKKWAETTLCDVSGRHNFSALQAIVMRSVVESGEVIVKKTRDAEANKLQILEADFIDTSMDNGKIVQGVEFGPDGKRSKYYLFSEHPGDGGTLKSQPYDANSVFHVYKEDRPGQVRGISWFHNVLNILEDLKEFQRATLIKQKISACLTVFVSKPNAQLGLTNDQKTAKRDGEWALEPASIYYLDDGESVSFSQPPSVSGYGEFCEHTLRTVASGLGVTYEQLTGDYSKVNFSSGRMGNLEMRRQVESWRWDMLIPQFCEPAFKHFLEWATIVYGVSPEGVEVGWVTPAWTMIDPEKELRASILAIRNGLTTTPNVIREQGYNPSQIVEEQREWNKIIDANELILDSDPRKQSSAGQAQSIQSGDNNAKKANKDAAKASNSGEDNA